MSRDIEFYRKLIPKHMPCTIDNMPGKIYHSLHEYMSNSVIKLYLDSPLTYKERFNIKKEKKEAFEFGSAYHCYIESQLKSGNTSFFNQKYIIFNPYDRPDKTKRITSKENEAWYKEHFVKSNKTIIKISDLYDIECMFEVIKSRKDLNDFISEGYSEQSIFATWRDIDFKIRPDYRNENYIVDFKSTNSIDEYSLSSDISKYRLDLQAALYIMIEHKISGNYNKKFTWIFQEKTYPFDIVYYHPSIDMLNIAIMQLDELVQQHRLCIINNHWPGKEVFKGFEDGLYKICHEIELPSWHRNKIFNNLY